ncbi:hypothetical protein BEP19_02730 [Ammoniphilus oxalaticus]|uniref:Carbohydrate kinase PfkB domain-containing protein n=1 Tax=Ammoniphilus oxalaticus TaxID=66863 RepID=A0A419SNI4_9BACL|nr:PfkB family carbohydrate kinase [Ammoniphilus oxalaticus]RKD25864.1 hypothetical protein BEP19_02730 [Ammoniphilus oxalaticus]
MAQGVFVGLAGFDITYYQNDFPEENQKSKTNNYQTFIGGPAGNAAITYAILGGRATLVTCLGDSPIADAIKIELSEVYQVEVIDLAVGSNVLPSISSVLVHTEKATRTIWSGQQQFFVPEQQGYTDWITGASFCFSDCNLPEVTIECLKQASQLNNKIVLDLGSWKPHFTDCLPLANEVIASVHCRPPAGELVPLLQKLKINKIATTDGEKATCWFDQSHLEQGVIMPPMVTAVDTLAAGDVLSGAYCFYRFNEGLSFVDALEKATIVASESVKFIGPREGVYKIANHI